MQRAACEGRGVAAEKLFSAEDITADPERVAPCVLELQALEAAAGVEAPPAGSDI